MNNDKNIVENPSNSIRIKTSDANTAISITVPSKELSSKGTENTRVFNVHEDGKLIFNCNNSENDIKSVTTPIKEEIIKEKLLSKVDRRPSHESLAGMFEKLPEDLSEYEISKIIEFLNEKAPKEGGCSRIYPYSVSLTESGDIKITLVIYNGGEFPFALQKIPLKLLDANKSIIIADLVDINAAVACGKIGIVQTIVTKEKLREKTINLEEWDITFTM